jgi:hypothetical protein
MVVEMKLGRDDVDQIWIAKARQGDRVEVRKDKTLTEAVDMIISLPIYLSIPLGSAHSIESSISNG